MKLIIPQITDPQMEVFIECCERMFDRYGIHRDTDPFSEFVTINGEKKPFFNPTLKEFYAEAKFMRDEQIEKNGKAARELLTLISHFRPFIEGAYRYMCNNGKLEWDKRLIVFAIEGMPDSVSDGLTFLILRLIRKSILHS